VIGLRGLPGSPKASLSVSLCRASAWWLEKIGPAPSRDAVKRNGRRVAPTAGCVCDAIGQETFRLSADDLPVLRSATMS
jgi:hypothetical protein